MNIPFYKYQGAGNDFIMIDNRSESFPKNATNLIAKLCNRHFGIGADGLILLELSEKYDFSMTYFNSDGKESSMCGNGGRCIVRFAEQLKIVKDKAVFEAIDGIHKAFITKENIQLQMADVESVSVFDHHYFLNTGSPHHVEFKEDIKDIDVKNIGANIRYGAPYFSEGTNVNFVKQIAPNQFDIRTYERGVEDETLACGTGATAVAITAYVSKKAKEKSIEINTLGGKLTVSFKENKGIFSEIFLTGNATFVFKGTISI